MSVSLFELQYVKHDGGSNVCGCSVRAHRKSEHAGPKSSATFSSIVCSETSGSPAFHLCICVLTRSVSMSTVSCEVAGFRDFGSCLPISRQIAMSDSSYARFYGNALSVSIFPCTHNGLTFSSNADAATLCNVGMLLDDHVTRQ